MKCLIPWNRYVTTTLRAPGEICERVLLKGTALHYALFVGGEPVPTVFCENNREPRQRRYFLLGKLDLTHAISAGFELLFEVQKSFTPCACSEDDYRCPVQSTIFSVGAFHNVPLDMNPLYVTLWSRNKSHPTSL